MLQTIKHSETKQVSPLQRLHTLLQDDLAAVNAMIVNQMQSNVPLIPELASYLIAAGGKRMRPLLTLAAAKINGDIQGDAHVKLATAVEFIHTATLLHDDVVDESYQRRGKPSANAIFGNQSSVLVGDFLFSRAFQLMVGAGDINILGILSSASCIIAEGEVMQMAAIGNLELSVDEYLTVVEAKTAALFAAATRSGAMVAGLDKAQIDALYLYGLNLGIAFQIADDVLDYSADQIKLGKNIGDDFREGKITLPIVTAYAQSSAEEKKFWQETVGADDGGNEEQLNQACDLLNKYQALEQSLQMANDFADKAITSLEIFPQSPLTDVLKDLARFSVTRQM